MWKGALFKTLAIKPTTRVIPSKFTLDHGRLGAIRFYTTQIPSSVAIKAASIENGIDISEKAVKQLNQIYSRDNDTEQLLRVLVDSGGCHGYQNKMELTKEVQEDDVVFEKEGAKVVIDAVSLQFLRGSVVDYVQELIGSTFQVVDNPNAKHSCGCNISYDIDLDKIQFP
ncbi:hypothetical protein K501DRAFT_325437 [Backusella circina FSU 941]|nr:hypothetical protein K501DRAFT_325437 [Backusella circina FSU 941]